MVIELLSSNLIHLVQGHTNKP